MTRAINTRIARLEKKAGINARPLPLFFIIFVTPGPPQEAVRAECYDNEQTWTRLPDETEDAFQARISGDLPSDTAKRGGIVLLFPEDRLVNGLPDLQAIE